MLYVQAGIFIGFDLISGTPFPARDWLLILTRMNNYMPSKVWDGITYPFPNFNVSTVEFWQRVSNFIPYFVMDVITYPCYPAYFIHWSQGYLTSKAIGWLTRSHKATMMWVWENEGGSIKNSLHSRNSRKNKCIDGHLVFGNTIHIGFRLDRCISLIYVAHDWNSKWKKFVGKSIGLIVYE